MGHANASSLANLRPVQNSSPARALLGALTAQCSWDNKWQLCRGEHPQTPSFSTVGPEASPRSLEPWFFCSAFPAADIPAIQLSKETEHFWRTKQQDTEFTLKKLLPCKILHLHSLCILMLYFPVKWAVMLSQSVKTQEGRSLTDSWQKEQDLPPYFAVGWNEFLLTSFLAQSSLACQVETCMHNHCWSCLPMDLLSQDHCISTFKPLTWVLSRLRGETTESNILERLLKSFAPATAKH